jgi:multisubunit Na+/H+ antiporter MnhG subunit
MGPQHEYIVFYVFLGLFLASLVFAGVLALERVREWYVTRNKTWLMVVIGTLLILTALRVLVIFEVISLYMWSLAALACCVAGAPIVFGQLLQDAHEKGKLASKDDNRRNHAAKDTRR